MTKKTMKKAMKKPTKKIKKKAKKRVRQKFKKKMIFRFEVINLLHHFSIFSPLCLALMTYFILSLNDMHIAIDEWLFIPPSALLWGLLKKFFLQFNQVVLSWFSYVSSQFATMPWSIFGSKKRNSKRHSWYLHICKYIYWPTTSEMLMLQTICTRNKKLFLLILVFQSQYKI